MLNRRGVEPKRAKRWLGVLCNLGTLYRQKGDKTKAVQYYTRATEYLTALLPPERGAQDEEIRDLHIRRRQLLSGRPRQ